MSVILKVAGQPVPQPRPRVVNINGRSMSYVDKTHPIHGYRAMIAAEAKAAGVKPHPGVVDVSIAFVFERPKSHLRANGSLTPKALQLPPCDWDNLAKGVCDALTGIAYNDDRQIRQCIVWKDYGRRAETVIEIVFRGMRWQSS